MLKDGDPQPLPLAGFFMDGDLDPVGGFCGWDARLGYRGLVRNCGCSVQFQLLCLISPLVDYAGFLGKKLYKYVSGCIVAAAQEAVYQFSGLSIVSFESNDHAQQSNPKPSTALVNFAF